MNFTVPAEYEKFVSSTEELLGQFAQPATEASGLISYCIHWLDGQLLNGVDIREDIMRIVGPVTSGYLWHNEQFQLVIQADVQQGTLLRGSTKIGDCVDDEWFIVYLLYLISKSIPDVAISVDDADGQFLLMEGADHIPDWLGPENAENRVWLRSGGFHIIPIDEPGRSKSGGMVLEKALKCVIKPNGFNQSALANSAFHQAIFNRTTDVYPAKIRANDHIALCIVPEWLATLIEVYPGIVARGVDAFHNTDQEQLRKYCAASALGTSSKGRALSADTLRAVPVRLTRVMYAQLAFKNFRPPRKYHGLLRRVSGAASRKVNQAFDVGCRLACGLECAYQSSLEQNKNKTARNAPEHADLQSNPQWKEVLQVAQRSSYPLNDTLQVEKLQNLFLQHLIMSAANFDRLERKDGAYPQGFYRFVDSKLAELPTTQVESAALDDSALETADKEVFRSVVEGTVQGDEEAWLYMSPEELDKEMEARVRSFATTSPQPTTSTCDTAASPEDTPGNDAADGQQAESSDAVEDREAAQNLQSMVDGIKSFLQGSSDIDGVALHNGKPAGRAGKAKQMDVPAVLTPEKTTNASAIVEDVAGVGLTLDMSYLDSLLLGAHTTAAPALVAGGKGSDSNAQSTQQPTPSCNIGSATTNTTGNAEAVDLAGYFSKEDLEEFNSDAEEGDSGEESDLDEADDLQGSHAVDTFLESVLSSNSHIRSDKGKASRNAEPPAPYARSESGAVTDGAAVLGIGTGYLSPSGAMNRSSSNSHKGQKLDSDDEVDPVDDTQQLGGPGAEDTQSVDSNDFNQDGLDEETIKEFQVTIVFESDVYVAVVCVSIKCCFSVRYTV